MSKHSKAAARRHKKSFTIAAAVPPDQIIAMREALNASILAQESCAQFRQRLPAKPE